MAKKRSSGSRKKRGPTGAALDSRVLEVMKASGILKPDVTLEQLAGVSQQLSTGIAARGFIFKQFVYRRCSPS